MHKTLGANGAFTDTGQHARAFAHTAANGDTSTAITQEGAHAGTPGAGSAIDAP